ncbi:MAG: DUF4249 domain-containing protein [Flavobacteriales bacterium]
MRKLLYISASLLFFFASCEKVISVDLEEGEKKLIVDGFLTNEATAQKIKLSVSQPYFDNATPPPATGAIVKVISSIGDTFDFVENGNSGEYIWTPGSSDSLCKIGLSYTLEISYKGSVYNAYSSTNPVPKIDSINFIPNTGFGSVENTYLAEFHAMDSAGRTDYCWVKYYRNDTLFADASSMILVVNGAFNAPGADGFEFIIPVRFGINNSSKPYHIGDSVKVEILSITEATWQFLSETQTQLNNGGLFATPPANVRSNISKTSGSGMNALGWFSTSALSRRQETIK